MPIKLIVDEDEMIVEIYYPFAFLKPIKIVPLQDLECTFNYEVGARGGRSRNFRIMSQNVNIINISPDYNGWDEDCLLLLFKKLNELKELE